MNERGFIRRKAMTVLAAFALMTASFLVVIRCTSLGRSLIAKPQVSLSRVGVRDVENGGATLVFGLRVENPNPFSIKVDAVRYEIELNGKAFSKGRLDRPAEVAAKGESVVDIPVPVRFGDLFAQLMDFLATRTSKYRIKGDADFGVLTVPFDSSGEVKF